MKDTPCSVTPPSVDEARMERPTWLLSIAMDEAATAAASPAKVAARLSILLLRRVGPDFGRWRLMPPLPPPLPSAASSPERMLERMAMRALTEERSAAAPPAREALRDRERAWGGEGRQIGTHV